MLHGRLLIEEFAVVGAGLMVLWLLFKWHDSKDTDEDTGRLVILLALAGAILVAAYGSIGFTT